LCCYSGLGWDAGPDHIHVSHAGRPLLAVRLRILPQLDRHDSPTTRTAPPTPHLVLQVEHLVTWSKLSRERKAGAEGQSVRFTDKQCRMSARGTIGLREIARPEILDAGRIERNYPRHHVVFVRHRTARAGQAFCSTLFSTSSSILVACKSAVFDLLTSWATIACRLVVVAPAPVGRGQRRRVQRGDQQRRQVLAARAARVAGLTLPETPARGRLAVAVLVLTVCVGDVATSISPAPISAGPLPSLCFRLYIGYVP